MAVALALLVLAPSAASAHESGGAMLPADVPAVTDEGARAKVLLRELAAVKDPAPDAARAIGTARKALSRAHGAHLAGDAAGARRLGRVALRWAEASKAQLAAATAERRGAAIEREAADLSQARDRARAMIVEAQARKGQLGAQIAQKKQAIDAAKAPPADAKAATKPSGKKPDAPKGGGPKTDAPKGSGPKTDAPKGSGAKPGGKAPSKETP